VAVNSGHPVFPAALQGAAVTKLAPLVGGYFVAAAVSGPGGAQTSTITRFDPASRPDPLVRQQRHAGDPGCRRRRQHRGRRRLRKPGQHAGGHRLHQQRLPGRPLFPEWAAGPLIQCRQRLADRSRARISRDSGRHVDPVSPTGRSFISERASCTARERAAPISLAPFCSAASAG
jgi:hypothetical protein